MSKITMIIFSVMLFTQCTTKNATTESFDVEKEKAAIRAVIAKETESYYKQDYQAWKSTYLQSPAFRKFGYWEGYDDKVVAYIGFDTLDREKKKQFEANETLWQGSVEERSNENFRIKPQMAWYTFEENSYDK